MDITRYLNCTREELLGLPGEAATTSSQIAQEPAGADEDDSKNQVIDPLVCMIPYNEFLSMSEPAFKLVAEAAFRNLKAVNESGHLRLFRKNRQFSPDARFLHDNNDFHTKLFDNNYGDPETDRTVTDVIAGYALGENGECIYLQGIPFAGFIRLAAASADGRKRIADGIRSIMRDHYYSYEDLISKEEEAGKTETICAQEKQKKEDLARKKKKREAEKEKQILLQKYGIKMNYFFGQGIEKDRYGKERVSWYNCLYSSLNKDEGHEERLAKYETYTGAIKAATGKSFNIMRLAQNSMLGNLLQDAKIARSANPEKETGCLLPDGSRVALSHWMVKDIACSSEIVFKSMEIAIHAFMQQNGIEPTP